MVSQVHKQTWTPLTRWLWKLAVKNAGTRKCGSSSEQIHLCVACRLNANEVARIRLILSCQHSVPIADYFQDRACMAPCMWGGGVRHMQLLPVVAQCQKLLVLHAETLSVESHKILHLYLWMWSLENVALVQNTDALHNSFECVSLFFSFTCVTVL